MEEYVCTHVYVPLRKGPSHRAEMGSQILFGENFFIIEKAANWGKIRNNWHNYTGWIDLNHVDLIPATDKGDSSILYHRATVKKADGSYIAIEPGSEIYSLSADNKTFQLGGVKYESNEVLKVNLSGEPVSQTAYRFYNTPYLWGGKTASGMDCSGLTQLAYKLHRIRIPHDSFEQAECGTTVEFLSEAVPGDLLFFDEGSGKISHVGIYFGDDKIIHSSGRVRIDKIDHQGIFREEIKKYTHRLRVIKRIVK